MDMSKEVDIWYKQKLLPGFLIRNLNSYKVMDGEVSKFQVRFQISNPENADGIITFNVEFNDPNRQNNEFQGDFQVDFSRKLFIPAKSSFDVGYVFNTEPARMSLVTHISKNLPNNLTYGFSGFTETRNVPILDEVVPVRFFDKTNADNEIIADNEEMGFLFHQTSYQAYLKSRIKKDKNDRYKYSPIGRGIRRRNGGRYCVPSFMVIMCILLIIQEAVQVSALHHGQRRFQAKEVMMFIIMLIK